MKKINSSLLRQASLLILITLLSCSPVGKYREMPDVVAWQTEIENFEQQDKTEKHVDDAILFTGSSSIRLWADIEEDMSPYKVIRRGYGGAKLSDFTVYADRIISPHKCRAIVIFIANDITGSKSDKSPGEAAALFRCLLGIIRRSHPATPVFWIGITPTAARWNAWNKIELANRKIADVCSRNKNTWFIRTDTAFLDCTGMPRTELFIDDKLHLSRQGYLIWAGIIRKELDNALATGNQVR